MITNKQIGLLIYTMKELIKVYDQYTIKPVKADLTKGFELSRKIVKQEEEIPITPIFKNILKKYDPKIDRLKVNTPETNAERYVNKYVEDKLNKRFGSKVTDYDRKNILDDHNQAVDCWRNFKTNMRHIRPDQSTQRNETIHRFYNKTKISGRDMIKMISEDLVLQKAISVVMSELPEVKASNDLKQVSIPFMTKHTNVSFPFWMNDRATTKDGRTYAQLTLDIASRTPIEDIHKYNVATLYGRNQRGKGRAIIAISRIPNLIMNRLESEEIKAYKAKSPLFVGYGDDLDLKHGLIQIAKFCKSHKFNCENFDYSKFDSTVSEGFIILLGAISIIKSINQTSKKIAFHRCLTMLRSILISGYEDKPKTIYGRVFSGHIDTNRGGGIINAIAATYALMKQDPHYVRDIASKAPVRMMVMGDDNLCITPKGFDRDLFCKTLADLGFLVHPDKGEFGCFFLQFRLLNHKTDATLLEPTTSPYKMVYPWTRVLLSTLFKENTAGLGQYGWTMSIWQQLSKLVEDEASLIDILPILVENDKDGLLLYTPMSQILAGIKAEDNEASGKKDFKKRNMPTAMKLYDGDPTKERFFIKNDSNGSITLNESYLSKLQRYLRSAYEKTGSHKTLNTKS